MGVNNIIGHNSRKANGCALLPLINARCYGTKCLGLGSRRLHDATWSDVSARFNAVLDVAVENFPFADHVLGNVDRFATPQPKLVPMKPGLDARDIEGPSFITIIIITVIIIVVILKAMRCCSAPITIWNGLALAKRMGLMRALLLMAMHWDLMSGALRGHIGMWATWWLAP